MTRTQLIAVITSCCGQGDTEILAAIPTADTDDLASLVASCPAAHEEER